MSDETIYGLRLKVAFEGPLYAASVVQLLGGIDLVRLGLTMTDEAEAKMHNSHSSPRGPWGPMPWGPGPWDDAEIILRTAEGLRFYESKGSLGDLYKRVLYPAIAVAHVPWPPIRNGGPRTVMVQSITAGSLESVIADAVESVIKGIGDLFRRLSSQMKHREHEIRLLDENSNPGSSALARSAFSLGRAAIVGVLVELKSDDIEVEIVEQDELRVRQ